MVTVKYVGNGIISKGVYFRREKNDGLYNVEKDSAEYLLKTFPKQFILIEKNANKADETKEDKASAKKTRRRSRKIEDK